MRPYVSGFALRTAALVGLAVGLAGCGLDKKEIPGLAGPAELGLSFQLDARPDVVTANGYNTVSLQATLRNQVGQPAPGVGVFFEITDGNGNVADIGRLNNNVAVSGSNGVAQAIYTTPPRTDATGNTTILIRARPIGGDANGQVYRSVRIELRSAEPRLFPQIPGNNAPFCNFVMEPATGLVRLGQDLLAQSTSSDQDGTLVRYEWDFGDGTVDDKPDVVHRYGLPGEYSLVHVVTDNGGLQSACAAAILVQ